MVSAVNECANRTGWRRLRQPGRTFGWSETCGRRTPLGDGGGDAAVAEAGVVAVTCFEGSAESRSGACGDGGDGGFCRANSVRSSARDRRQTTFH